MTKATKMFVFVSRGDNWLSKLILRVLGEWTHMGLGFVLETGAIVYYEALFRKGVQGPKPLAEIDRWAAARPGRRYAMRLLPDMNSKAEEKRIIVRTYQDVAGYNGLQLLSMWFLERVGRRFGWRVPRSRGRVVCSELVARVLHPEYDLRDAERSTFDAVNPTSAWRRLLDILKAREIRPRIVSSGQGGATPAPPASISNAERADPNAEKPGARP